MFIIVSLLQLNLWLNISPGQVCSSFMNVMRRYRSHFKYQKHTIRTDQQLDLALRDTRSWCVHVLFIYLFI